MSGQNNVVGVHYKVGRRIGEGSFGVIFEGTNLLNNQQVAIKFVSENPFDAMLWSWIFFLFPSLLIDFAYRNQDAVMLLNYVMNTVLTSCWQDVRVFRMFIILAKKGYITFWWLTFLGQV